MIKSLIVLASSLPNVPTISHEKSLATRMPRHVAAASKVISGLVKRQITLHVVRLDVLLHTLGGFAELAPLPTYFWMPQEDEYLRRAYTFVGMYELQERLLRRTPGSIRKRACDLGLTRPKRRAFMDSDSSFVTHDVLRPSALSGVTQQRLLAEGASTTIRRRLPPLPQAARRAAHGTSLAQGDSPAQTLDLADHTAPIVTIGRGRIDEANTLAMSARLCQHRRSRGHSPSRVIADRTSYRLRGANHPRRDRARGRKPKRGRRPVVIAAVRWVVTAAECNRHRTEDRSSKSVSPWS